MDLMKERQALDRISQNSLYSAGPSAAMVEYSFEVLSRHLVGNTILELGPAEGLMTDRLATLGKPLTVVEGAEMFCKELRRRHPSITVINSLFEEFNTHDRFDNIVMGHVLEHVEDPVTILLLAKQWLALGGRVLAAVPNARSIHRQAAVIMGLLTAEDAMNELDRHHGHRRVFNPESFRACFTQAGYRICFFGGYWLKPVSNQQILDSWTPQMLDAFMRLGERYPDIAAEVYVIATQLD